MSNGEISSDYISFEQRRYKREFSRDILFTMVQKGRDHITTKLKKLGKFYED